MNRRGKDVFSKLSQIRLRAGDELLVQGPAPTSRPSTPTTSTPWVWSSERVQLPAGPDLDRDLLGVLVLA